MDVLLIVVGMAPNLLTYYYIIPVKPPENLRKPNAPIEPLPFPWYLARMSEKPSDPISFSDARALLGVSKSKLHTLYKSGVLGEAYIDPLNKRYKYLSRAKVEALKQQSVQR